MFYLILVLSLFVCDLSTLEYTKEYGPYKIDFVGFEMCRGPKRKDLATFSMEMRKSHDKYRSTMNLTVPAVTILDEVKVTVYEYTTTNDKRKNILWNYKVDKPCKHIVIANVIKTITNDTSCIVKQGDYSVVVNLTDISHAFFGSSFFYGAYTFKSSAFSKKGNVLCFVLHTIVSKK